MSDIKHICTLASTCRSASHCSHAKPHAPFDDVGICTTPNECCAFTGNTTDRTVCHCAPVQSAIKTPAIELFEVTQYKPKITADKYTVIEKAGANSWAVRDGFGACLSNNLEWVDEPMPSARTPEFLAEHRFPTAEAAAEAYAKHINGICLL